MLDRLTDFSKLKTHASSRWTLFGRLLVGTVVVGNILGLCCNIVGSVFFLRLADSYEKAASNASNTAEYIDDSSQIDFNYGFVSLGVFFGFETIMLPLVVIAFVVVGAASIRRFRSAIAVQKVQLSNELGTRSKSENFISKHQLKRQIVGTCGILFVSVFIRTVVAMMQFIGGTFGNFYDAVNRCGEKDNSFALLSVWILYTPQFYFLVMLFCQPLTLLVTLWGMTSGQTLAVMRANSLN